MDQQPNTEAPQWAVPLDCKVREPKTHDYTRRSWGHDYSTMDIINEGLRLKLAGWGHGIKNGDYLILSNGPSTTRYRVENIKYKSNPSDMWFADCTFAPRQSRERSNVEVRGEP